MTDRSRIGKRNQKHGKAGQLQAARYLCDLWGLTPPKDYCDWTQNHPDLRFHRPCPAFGDHIEAKAWRHWAPREWIYQAMRDAGTAPWWIIFKRPGTHWRDFASPWYVLTREETYLAAVDAGYGKGCLNVTPGPPSPQDRASWMTGAKLILMLQIYAYPGYGRWPLEKWVLRMERDRSPADYWWLLRLELAGEWFSVVPGEQWADVLRVAWERRKADDV